ncbi:putative RNA-binding protein EEED8.10 isoform X2 [Venturia canescens]|uniref:putative RNA-binding protein EEED8.10 isoform X2 n=1 Tax=Venturia canescens TaxID=32260 RepID=UPI001C9C35C7|nr:putative RNA-binding protein EEED8.10 isoform X2 [Venturia canescens]
MLGHYNLCTLLEETDEGVPVRKLFISNLADRTSNKDLEKIFSIYGSVESCYLKRNNGKSNFAFVTFSNSADALKARQAACAMTIQLHCRLLRVSPADSWHQPDSPENCRKFLSNKDNGGGERPQEEGNNDDAPIHTLNDDCLTEIFLCLPVADRIRMERVCKRWQAVSHKSWRAVKKLDLSSLTWGLNTRMRKQYVDTPALRKVLLKCGNFLNHIDFSHPHILSPSALTIVGKFCPNLQTVDISHINLSQAGIRSLSENCKNITKFVMKSLTGPCEKDLAQLFAVNKKLKSLKITKSHHMSGRCLLHLPCESIQEIHLHNGIAILPCHMDATTLTTLQLDGEFPIVSAVALQQIAQLFNLETLVIRRNYLLTNKLLHLLAVNCKRLSLLDIFACEFVTNEGLASIATLPNLQHLVISYVTSITDEGLVGMHNLRTLECHRCITLQDAGVSSLIEMAPNLELLDLSGCPITNTTLEVAIKATKRRSNNVILKIVIGDTLTNLAEITQVSPLLQIVNVCLDHEKNIHNGDMIDLDLYF